MSRDDGRPTFRQIEAFRAAAQLSTVTAAAHALGLGQPAVSRLLSDLESRLGHNLFDRRGRGLILTSDGELLREEVERSFAGLNSIAEAATAIRRHAAGRIRVAALHGYGNGFVATAVGVFLRAHCGVNIELQSLDKIELVKSLAMERFDFGVGTVAVNTDILVVRPLVRRAVVLIFPPGKTPPARLNWNALTALPLIALRSDTPFRLAFDLRVKELGLRPRFVAEMSTQHAICLAVQAGGGVGMVEDALAQEFASAGLSMRPLPETFDWQLALLHSRRRRLSPTANLLAREIAIQAKESRYQLEGKRRLGDVPTATCSPS